MTIDNVNDETMLETALGAKVAVLYKHSTVCGVSAVAMKEIRAFAEAHPDVTVFVVDVRAQRPLSQLTASRLGIHHESPQAIVIRHGAAVWHASHFDVTAQALSQALFGD